MVKKLGKMPVIMFDVKAQMALKIGMLLALFRTKDLMRLFFRDDGKNSDSAFADKLALIGVGKTCEIRCAGRHDSSGNPLDYRLTGEGQGSIF